MSGQIVDVERLHEYLVGVVGRADHHGQNVHEVALTVAGAMVWRKEPGRPIEVRQQDGEMKNVLWVWIGGKKYALAYHHKKEAIEVRERMQQGRTLMTFTNANTAGEVRAFFESL